jgi:hypothetical protein
MAACYHDDVVFSDAVFRDLRGLQASNMWRMLCEHGTDLRIEFSDVSADDVHGRAHWEAWYTFSTTRRPVHNKIDASFQFRDGMIIRHVDNFSFGLWARQALGAVGWLLGWSGFLRERVRGQAMANLDTFQRRGR